MGCFDEVRIACPQCGTITYAQSKGGSCSMSRYDLKDCPEDVLTDVNRHAPFMCKSCGTMFEVQFTSTVVRV